MNNTIIQPRILVVDDEEYNVELMEAILSPKFLVLKAYSGKEGLQKALEEEPDLILLDIMMPDMTGYEVCKILKNNERTKIIPIVMVTALTDRDAKIRSLDEGADDFLNKPSGYQEIHSRVNSLLKIKRLQERIIEERNQSLRYLDATGSIVVILSKDLTITFLNKRTCRLLGFNRNELIGKKWIDNFIPDDLKETNREYFTAILEGQTPEKRILEDAILVRNDKGETQQRIILWNDVLLKDDKENIIGLIRAGDDFTEIKEQEKKIVLAHEKLQSIHKMKDEFLANISHELRTPLISIKGFSELLYSNRIGEINKQQHRAMGAIVRNAQRLRHLVESLFYVTTMQDNVIRYTFTEIQLKDIIETAFHDMGPQLDKKNISINLNMPPEIPLVHGNKNYIERVTLHLLDKAIEYSIDNSSISLQVTNEKDMIHLVISFKEGHVDTDDLHLFCNEYTDTIDIDDDMDRLGLSLSKKIINSHDGDIWIKKGNDEQIQYHIVLPVLTT